MKTIKQIITVVAFAMFMLGSFNGNAQEVNKNTALNKITVSRVGQLHAVITFLETKEFYQKVTSESEFINKILSTQFDNGQRPKYFENYLSFIYKFHANNSTYDDVYAKTSGTEFADFMNSALKFHKRGMSKEKFESAIFLNGSKNSTKKVPKPKDGWLNFARKLIDLIDDQF